MEYLWDNYEDIKENNDLYEKRESNYKLEFNKFNILSGEEFAKSFLGVIDDSDDESRKPKHKTNPAECRNLPNSKNWVEEMKVAPVQSQGNCGSCYLFAALAILEAHAAIENNLKPVKLSTQNTLECVKTFGIKSLEGVGCDGGRPEVKVCSNSIQSFN